MSIAATDILDKVVSHAASLGVFKVVNDSAFNNSPGKELSAAIWLDSIVPVRSSAINSTSVCMTFIVQIYAHLIQSPADLIDKELINAVDLLCAAYSEDFTLDGAIRQVDLLGNAGTPMEVDAGYISFADDNYRVANITLPLIVNDVWGQG